ncbi:MAG: CoA transferase [Chloroflexota bacterium]|nr:CoA transferase [Chloroflexota bacterium]
MTKPLEGIRVLEYATFHAGPGAGAILADLGAEVIKVETKKGDALRRWHRLGPYVVTQSDGQSYMYEVSNRGKKGIVLDITQEKGRKIFDRLVQKSDVFLTNLRYSTVYKLGLDYDSIVKENPRIVYSRISGYGANGEDNDQGAYDFLAQARCGFMRAVSNGVPTPGGVGIIDQAASIAATHGIITALFVRERTGKGQEVHSSLLSSGSWLLHVNLMAVSLTQKDLPAWDRSLQSPLRNTFFCKGGDWIVGTNHPPAKYWEALCRATGLEHLLSDPRFDTDEDRWQNNSELVEIFDEVFATKTREEWLPILKECGMMFSPVQSCPELLDDPQALANDYVVAFDHPSLGSLRVPGYPIHFSETPADTKQPAPQLGEHTEEVLRDVGCCSQQDIELLRCEGVI